MDVILQDKCCIGTGLAGGGLLLPPALLIRSVVPCSKTRYGLNRVTAAFGESGMPR